MLLASIQSFLFIRPQTVILERNSLRASDNCVPCYIRSYALGRN